MGGLNGIAEMQKEARGLFLTIIDRLEQIVEVQREQDVQENYLYRRVALQAAADGTAQDSYQLPPGVFWKIKRFTVTGAANGQFAVYVDEVQPQNLVDGQFTNASMAAWSPGEDGVYVPAGSTVIFRFFNQPVGQVVTVNMRITEIAVKE